MNPKILLPILPVIALYLLWPTAPERAARIDAEPIAMPASVPAAPHVEPARAVSAVDDESRTYVLSYRYSLRVGSKAPSAMDIRAGWSVLPLDARTWAVEVSGARVSPGGPQVPGPAELDTTFFLRTDERGALSDLAFDPTTGEIARIFLETLATSVQLTRGAAAGWTSVETDGTGRYRATHERRRDTIVRTKASYHAVLAPNVRPEALHLDGQATATLDSDGRLEALISEDHVRARLGSELPEVTSVARAELTPDAPRSLDRARLTRLAASAEFRPIGLAARTPVSARDMDLAATGGASWRDLGDDLHDALAEPDDEQRRRRVGKIISKLGAAIRLEPNAAAEAAQAALAPGAPLPEIDAMAGALAAANTRESTRALESMLAADASSDVRRHAAVSLALSDVVDDQTASALADASQDPDPHVRSAATLALGAAAPRLPAGSGQDPVAELLERYAAAHGDDRLLLLEALANSGDPRILPTIAEALASPDPDVAATAAYALRFVRTPEADERLGQLLAHPIPQLRTAAVKAIRLRDVDAWRERLVARLDAEPDEQLRGLIASLVRPAVATR